MTAAPSPPSDSGVFDAGPLLEMSKSNPVARETLLGLIRNFVERSPVQFADARTAWRDGRTEEAARTVHTMRGSIGTLGARRFANATHDLEAAIRAGQAELAGGLFDHAEQELATAVEAAKRLLAQQATPPPAPPPAPTPVATPIPSPTAPPRGDSGSDLVMWFEHIRSDLREIGDDVRQIADELKDLSQTKPFTDALAASPSCLVVEDDELISHVLLHLLKREGYRVERCADGRAARQAIEQASQPPGLILLDVMLPYADGFELIHLIRDQKRWTTVPIIMLTAKQNENDIVRALDAGATDYIVKPFQPNELMARLRRILRTGKPA